MMFVRWREMNLWWRGTGKCRCDKGKSEGEIAKRCSHDDNTDGICDLNAERLKSGEDLKSIEEALQMKCGVHELVAF
jgi:hypothetical protein